MRTARAFHPLGERLHARSPVTGRVASFECEGRQSSTLIAELLRRIASDLIERPDLRVDVTVAGRHLIVCIAGEMTVRLRPVTLAPDEAAGLLTHCLHAGISSDDIEAGNVIAVDFRR